MKRRPKLRLILVVTVIVAAASWWIYARLSAEKNVEAEIETAPVELGTVVKTASASGVLEPLTTVDVKSNAAGEVKELAVDVGTYVQPGQLIARIDPTDSETAYNQAEADLAASNARLAQAKESQILQTEQSAAAIRQAEQALQAARARLRQVEAEAAAQPALTKSTISQAQANYESARESLRQLREAGMPLGTAQARAAREQAEAALLRAEREVNRVRELHSKGFVSASQLDAAEAEYRSARAAADSARERVDTLSEDYEAQLRVAEARVEQTKAALDHARAAAVQDDIKKQEVASARAAVRQAEAALEAARSNARQNRIRSGDIRSAEAQVVRNRAELDRARVQLGYTTVVAPRAGVILKKYVEAGTIITSGRASFAGTGEGTSIVQLGDLSRMFVIADVDETDIALVEVGQEVEIRLDAYPDEKFHGRVTRIDPQTQVEQNVTTIPVTVEIENPDARLKPGMNATCDFIVERRFGVLRVPSEAINDEGGEFRVTVIKDGKQETRKVKIGLTGDQYTQITSGLKEGEVVVTSAPVPAAGQPPGGVGGMPPRGFPGGRPPR